MYVLTVYICTYTIYVCNYTYGCSVCIYVHTTLIYTALHAIIHTNFTRHMYVQAYVTSIQLHNTFTKALYLL